jgi:protein O-GlcNAc transferase
VLRRLAGSLIASGRRAEQAGHTAGALRRYRAAAWLAPGLPAARLNEGAVLEAEGDGAAALLAYESALRADATDPYANYNVGRLCFWQGDAERAERLICHALALRPQFPDALVMLAYVLDARKAYAEAAASLEAALRLQPDATGPWYNYGEVLWKLNRFDAAEAALRRSLELEPEFVPAWQLLGSILRSAGQIDAALAAVAQARRVEPSRFDLESMELLTLSLSDTLSAQALFDRHRVYGRRLEGAIPPRTAPYAQSRDPGRRLRVGYLSCNFNRHPVSWFLLPLLERHDRAQVESRCYYTGDQMDEVTGQLRAAADGWRDVKALEDEALARVIEEDGIDVLVDLTGHAGALRHGVFARQPAPVQLAWLGYLHSTGLTRIAYRITDARADPPGESDALHTETLVRLPHSQWCFRPSYEAKHAAAAPCMRTGAVTFGSFNHAPKLSATTRRLWAAILRALPQTRLRLVGVPEGRGRDALLRDFADAGVDPARLTVLPRISVAEYLTHFDAVDIALDSTPYGGGTTTFDCLWMGVPVLTLAGDRSTARSAASILGALGLEDWIAGSAEEYLARALNHVREPARLVALRGSLRERLRSSPLMDEVRFARDMEAAYRGMWRAWCARPIA